MKILVTGSSGFIGSNLVQEIFKGYDVFLFDKFFHKDINNFFDAKQIIKGDLRNSKDLTKVPSVDVVFNLASQLPYKFKSNSVLGIKNLIKWCLKNDVKKIIHSSSAAVYGEPKNLPIKEDHPILPISQYGKYKLVEEQLISTHPSYLILRYANVYGPNGTGIVTELCKKTKKGGTITIFDDGNQTRDFIHVKDVTQANLRSINYRGKEKVFNVGTGVETSINQLISIFKELNPLLKVSYLPQHIRRISRSYFDISKIKNEMDFIPTMKLKIGIKEMMETVNDD